MPGQPPDQREGGSQCGDKNQVHDQPRKPVFVSHVVRYAHDAVDKGAEEEGVAVEVDVASVAGGGAVCQRIADKQVFRPCVSHDRQRVCRVPAVAALPEADSAALGAKDDQDNEQDCCRDDPALGWSETAEVGKGGHRLCRFNRTDFLGGIGIVNGFLVQTSPLPNLRFSLPSPFDGEGKASAASRGEVISTNS